MIECGQSRRPSITGSASADTAMVGEAVARIKRHTKLPVCVGFGIRTPEAARGIARNADGAVVGTALVDAVRGSLVDPKGTRPAPVRRGRRSWIAPTLVRIGDAKAGRRACGFEEDGSARP